MDSESSDSNAQQMDDHPRRLGPCVVDGLEHIHRRLITPAAVSRVSELSFRCYQHTPQLAETAAAADMNARTDSRSPRLSVELVSSRRVRFGLALADLAEKVWGSKAAAMSDGKNPTFLTVNSSQAAPARGASQRGSKAAPAQRVKQDGGFGRRGRGWGSAA